MKTISPGKISNQSVYDYNALFIIVYKQVYYVCISTFMNKTIYNHAIVNIDIAYVSLLVITLFLSNVIKNVKMLENSSALKHLVV